MESDFQLVTVPSLSQEGEKADYVCTFGRARILIYFNTRLTEYLKIEDKLLCKLANARTGVPG